MTREQIEKLSGRELDAAVNEVVFGLGGVIWPWSGTWDSADLVVGHMVSGGTGRLYDFILQRRMEDLRWRASFERLLWGTGDTAPEAICRAALLARMPEDDDA